MSGHGETNTPHNTVSQDTELGNREAGRRAPGIWVWVPPKAEPVTRTASGSCTGGDPGKEEEGSKENETDPSKRDGKS